MCISAWAYSRAKSINTPKKSPKCEQVGKPVIEIKGPVDLPRDGQSYEDHWIAPHINPMK